MVDLPQPEGPSRDRKDPLAVPRSVACSACTAFRPRVKVLLSPWMFSPVAASGSPAGSRVAMGAVEAAGTCPTACEQLVPDSDLLRGLNAGDETPEGPRWATVRSDADRVVTPTDSAVLAGARNVLVQDLCPGADVQHDDLPGDPRVARVLDAALGAGPVVAPEPGC